MIARLPALKTGRYELAARLSTSVKDNLWSNKSVTRSPAILPLSRSCSFLLRYRDLGVFFIESLDASISASSYRCKLREIRVALAARSTSIAIGTLTGRRNRCRPRQVCDVHRGRDMFFLGRECSRLTYYARNTCGAKRSRTITRSDKGG